MDKLNEPLAAALSRLKVLMGDESTDATSVRLPETRPSVTAKRREDFTIEPVPHSTELSESQPVDSQLLYKNLNTSLKYESPYAAPCTVTTLDPLETKLPTRILLTDGKAKDNASLTEDKIPSTAETDRLRVLPAPLPCLHITEDSEDHLVSSQLETPSLEPKDIETRPILEATMVKLDEPVEIAPFPANPKLIVGKLKEA